MKYFVDASNNLYAYESDGSQDAVIPAAFMPAPADVVAAVLGGVANISELRELLMKRVDAGIADIYEKFTRFEREYALREAAARAFKAAGYQGDAGTWVTAFSTAAGKTPKDAADLIIAQADAMYAALPVLGALRMRKYEIAAAASAANAQAIHDDILTRAAAAVAGL